MYWTRTPARNGDVAGFRGDLSAYVRGFSENVRDIFDRFEFAVQIDRLAKANLLYLVTEKLSRGISVPGESKKSSQTPFASAQERFDLGAK